MPGPFSAALAGQPSSYTSCGWWKGWFPRPGEVRQQTQTDITSLFGIYSRTYPRKMMFWADLRVSLWACANYGWRLTAKTSGIEQTHCFKRCVRSKDRCRRPKLPRHSAKPFRPSPNPDGSTITPQRDILRHIWEIRVYGGAWRHAASAFNAGSAFSQAR